MNLNKNYLLTLLLISFIAVGTLYFLNQRQVPAPTKVTSANEYQVDASDMLIKETSTAVTTETALSSEEKASLIYMREEEKLARDVYLALGEKWDQPVFSNIAKSEETHMNAVLGLLEKYSLSDPVVSDARGVFTQPIFQELYTKLVAKGQTSVTNAFEVGAEIEDLDIADLQKALDQTDNTDIERVYQNLMKGSRNHLRAFNRQLERTSGQSYQAIHISSDELQAILGSQQEKGPIR